MSFCDKQKSIKTLKNKPKSRYTSRVDFIRKISFEMELILGNETAFVFCFIFLSGLTSYRIIPLVR